MPKKEIKQRITYVLQLEMCIRDRTYTDEETGQTIIAGMGELHLEIIVDRLLREFKVEANVGAPQVAYKETVRKKVDQDTKYKRQSGGSGQYGHVKITVEPNESGKGYEFVNAVVGGAIPKEFIPAVDAGIQGALQSGVVAGFPVVDVKVTLYDGSYHEVDSSEMAFKIAGSMAFKEACRKADPVLLEPIMKVSVIVPDEYLGTVIGDLTSRRGQIQGQEARPGADVYKRQAQSIVDADEFLAANAALEKGQKPATFKPVHMYASEDEALMAYNDRAIGPHCPILVRRTLEVNGESYTRVVRGTPGQIIFNKNIPQDLGFVDRSRCV